MRIKTLVLMLIVAVNAGCASAQPDLPLPAPVRIDELATLSSQGLGDDALIAEMDRRGVAFVLSAKDRESLGAAGVSDGVLRYLQGRASADSAFVAAVQRGRYRVNAYSGALYLGYPYLGYFEGNHYYGDYGYAYRGLYYYGGRAGHYGGHGGMRHGGGHHGGRH